MGVKMVLMKSNRPTILGWLAKPKLAYMASLFMNWPNHANVASRYTCLCRPGKISLAKTVSLAQGPVTRVASSVHND